MGNEQSSSGTSPQASTNSTFSLLSGKGNSKKSKGIVVVSGGNAKVETLDDDEVYKRFKEIPRFLPILRHAIGKKDIPQSEIPHKVNSRPLFRMATRFQQHLKICATTIAADQSHINQLVKSVDASVVAISNRLNERKKVTDNLIANLQDLDKLRDDVVHIRLLFEHLVPMVETINEILVPSERLPPLALSRVLDRTPVSTSESSEQSTPRHNPSGSGSQPRSALSQDKTTRISPIEEVRVVDRRK
nr:Tumour suppressor protein domain containing protein [Haemonchus contortus]